MLFLILIPDLVLKANKKLTEINMRYNQLSDSVMLKGAEKQTEEAPWRWHKKGA
jgi:hypothetical protein